MAMTVKSVMNTFGAEKVTFGEGENEKEYSLNELLTKEILEKLVTAILKEVTKADIQITEPISVIGTCPPMGGSLTAGFTAAPIKAKVMDVIS